MTHAADPSVLPVPAKAAAKKSASILQVVLILLVAVAGIGIRLYDLQDPPLDFHPARQLRSAIIARAVYYRLDTTADAATRQLAQDLAQLEMYEPPILENIVGFTYYLVHGEYVWIARIYNAIFWLLGGAAIFLLGRRLASWWAALLGTAWFFCLPFSVYASRSFQPEPWMVMWILLCAYALYVWSDRPGWKWAILAGLSGGMAILVKVVAGYFIAGMAIGVVLATLGLRSALRSRQVWSMAALMLLPAAVLYLVFNPSRSGEFFSFWTVSLSGLIFTTNFYADWLVMMNYLVGLTNVVVALVGILLAERRYRWMLVGAWAGYVLYGLMFPYQYTTHEYYHLPLVGLTAMSLIPALDVVVKKIVEQAALWRLAAAGLFVFMAFYSLYVARSVLYVDSYAYEPASWQRVGEAIPAGRSFVALTADYGMRLRYYGWRAIAVSWPSAGDLNLSALHGDAPMQTEDYFNEVTAGKDYFLVTAFSELDAQPELKAILTTRYPLFVDGDGYAIYDLDHPLSQDGG
jgi:4-amino-4-deoxy-L-arabinose transferase-like glycosyltransferase